MDIFKLSERAMGMGPTVWARHANPKSVWSRILGGTLVFFAFWSWFWIGVWALAPIALALIWIWVNPRLFSPPASAESWAARGVLGERALINRAEVAIPPEFACAARITTGLALAFLGLCIWGFVRGEFWLAFTAWHAATVAKLWFVDRMAMLWDAVKDDHPVYAAWSRAEWGARFENV